MVCQLLGEDRTKKWAAGGVDGDTKSDCINLLNEKLPS